MSSVRIQLAPKAGFCIKSASLAAGVLPQAQKVEKNVLEPIPSAIPIPVHTKIFVNIAWDPHVPPPPEGSEDAIREAMQGEDVGEENEKGWYVPVIVSPGREDKDKSGNTAIVFDCIYNSSLKSRTLTDPEFKIFLVELALQRIEAQSGLTLSRSIGTPNIASKGKLLPRTVHVPASLLSGSRSKVFDKVEGAKREPLIQEVFGEHAPVTQPIQPSPVAPPPKDQSRKSAVSGEKDTLPGLRGILKKGSTKSSTSRPSDEKPLLRVDARAPLQWTWSKDESGKLVMDVQVPALTVSLIQASTLDIGPRHITLVIPGRPVLDLDLSCSDAEITSKVGNRWSDATGEEGDKKRQEETKQALLFKRQRDFDVPDAKAEWKIGTDTVRLLL